jgi:hypothetical protein
MTILIDAAALAAEREALVGLEILDDPQVAGGLRPASSFVSRSAAARSFSSPSRWPFGEVPVVAAVIEYQKFRALRGPAEHHDPR